MVIASLAILFAEAGGETKQPPNPVLPRGEEAAYGEMFWAAVFFLILLALMRYVLLPQVKRVMDERDAKLRADRDTADRAATELGTARSDYEAALAGARAEANAIIEEARREAETHRAGLQARADQEIAALRQAAQAEIAQARATALTSVRGDVAELATSAASAVIQRPVDRAASTAVVDRVIGNN
jgi:F-type H+-transporting ATPase subunit b